MRLQQRGPPGPNHASTNQEGGSRFPATGTLLSLSRCRLQQGVAPGGVGSPILQHPVGGRPVNLKLLMRGTEIVSAFSEHTCGFHALSGRASSRDFQEAKYQMQIINPTLLRLAADKHYETVVAVTRD